MSVLLNIWLSLLIAPIVLAAQCYFGPGAENRGPDELVPCAGSGDSACCLQGDTCLAGNTCYNENTGDLYQYGCTDIYYEASVCPYKCGFNATLSPWTALEYCSDIDNVTDTWVCHAPESCGCSWNSTYDLLILKPRGCKEMGSNARVALYAPSTLAPWISLPSTVGGSTGYYSPITINGTSTWIQTAVAGYTPSSITQLTTYGDQPTSAVLVEPRQTASPSTAGTASSTSPTASSTVSTIIPTTSSITTSSIASTSTGTSTSATGTPLPSPVSELSTGAKAGIGVGAAAGLSLVLLVAVLIYRKRKQSKQQTRAEVQQYPQGSQYPQGPGYPPGPYNPHSPPMQQQGFPYYPSPPQPHEKTGTWQQTGTYLPGSPSLLSPAQAPYYTGTIASLSPHTFDSPSPYGELPKAPVSPPLELSAEQRVHEMAHSNVGDVSAVSSPTPTYVEVEIPRK